MTVTDGTLLRARDALERNDTDGALNELRPLLAADPRHLDALGLRYRIERGRGQIGDAQKTLALIISIDPHADWAYNDLVKLLFENGRRDDAERIARVALRMNPGNATAHALFGTILSELNDLPSGEWHFRRALQLGGPEPQTTANLALNLMQQGRTDEADDCYHEANEAAPGNLRILSHWSKLAEVQGDLPRASALLDQAAAAASDVDVNLLRSRLLIRDGDYQEALEVLEACRDMNGDAHLERGGLYDRFGRYDEAWRDFSEGKRKLAAQAGNPAYQQEAIATFFNRLKRFFLRRNFELLPQAPLRADVPQPVFVCGFPRSGTTLVEQILSSHPDVRAGGELPFAPYMRNLANSLFPDDGAFPENLSRTWTADGHYVATLFRDYYLSQAARTQLLDPGRRFFIDKMPFNEMYFPLIMMAFPQSTIIRVVRHPLDVCVSMMSNNFTHGFNCGYRISDIVVHLAAVSDLVEHYAKSIQPREFVVRYEDLVADQETLTRELLDHAGLPFDEACMRFHENTRYAATPSYAQVTEPLNERSIGRHRHYAEHLREFLPTLRATMSALSYDATD